MVRHPKSGARTTLLPRGINIISEFLLLLFVAVPVGRDPRSGCSEGNALPGEIAGQGVVDSKDRNGG